MEDREEMYFKHGRLNRDSLRTLYPGLRQDGACEGYHQTN